MGNPLWCIVWFLVLIIAAFPIAFFCCFWYVICYFFSPCLDFCKVSKHFYIFHSIQDVLYLLINSIDTNAEANLMALAACALVNLPT
nr:unnamed protein product [Callosobruchus chinensis]